MGKASAGAPAGAPTITKAVSDVEKDLSQAHLVSKLRPKAEALSKTTSGPALHNAIAKLVREAVAAQVKKAFLTDPSVRKSVTAAVGSLRSKLAHRVAKGAAVKPAAAPTAAAPAPAAP